MPTMEKLSPVLFEKEIGFYKYILPLLNKELEKLKEIPLRMPRYLHSVSKDKEEVIFLEDMRKWGYRMLDRKIGMDRNHTMLIIKELARLHAISKILMNSEEFKKENLEKKFPFLEEPFEKMLKDMGNDKINVYMEEALTTSAEIAERNKGYEYAGRYLRTLIPKITEVMRYSLKAEDPFIAICHGDCWNNNFLYKYVYITYLHMR